MKKVLAVILASVMLFATACSSKSSDTTDTTVAGSGEVSAEYAVQYPVTVTDQAGREVVIESEPTKIVSGYYISSSLLIALELDSKMVGIEAKAGKRPIYSLSAPELIDLPSVGSAKEFDLEACISVEPDLVILPAKLKDVADSLTELGIAVLLVKPENEKLFAEMADLVATATNTVEKKNELMSSIENTKSILNTSLEGVEPVSVYLAGNSDFLSTASKGMYQSDMIALAGGTNVADEIDDNYWVEVSYEQVLSWNPEYIIIAAEAEYSVDDVLNDEALALCDAVVNGNVYKLPADAEAWDSPVPSSVLGSLWLSSVLYPDRISVDTCYDVIDEFYETFYGFSYSAIGTEKAA